MIGPTLLLPALFGEPEPSFKPPVSQPPAVDPQKDPTPGELYGPSCEGATLSFGSRKLILGAKIGSGASASVSVAIERREGNTQLFAVKTFRDKPGLHQARLFEAAGQPSRDTTLRWAQIRQEIDMASRARSAAAPLAFVEIKQHRVAMLVMPLMVDSFSALLRMTAEGAADYRTLLTQSLVPLLGALRALHQNGLAHMDLKPDNIFISPDHTLVLGDFGLATSAARLRGARGSPHWMAPEIFFQLKELQKTDNPSSALTQRSFATDATDLYSMGLIMLTASLGRNPFRFEDWHGKETSRARRLGFSQAMRRQWEGAHTALSASFFGEALPIDTRHPMHMSADTLVWQRFLRRLALPEHHHPLTQLAVLLMDPEPKKRRPQTPLELEALAQPAPSLTPLVAKLPSFERQARQLMFWPPGAGDGPTAVESPDPQTATILADKPIKLSDSPVMEQPSGQVSPAPEAQEHNPLPRPLAWLFRRRQRST